MPLDPETLKAIQDAIKESLPTSLSEAIKPLTEQLERQQYDNKKLSREFSELSNSIPSLLDEQFKDIKPSLDFIGEVRKEYEAEKNNPDSSDKSDTEKLRASIMEEIDREYKEKLTSVQSQLDERDKETKTLREADRQTKMRNEALNAMRGLGTVRLNTEEDLLTLIEKRGLLVEDGDRYFVKGPEKFGEATKIELKEILPKMLENDFAHFAVPRGGTGTDGSPGTRATPSQYNFEGMTAQDIYNRYGNDEGAQKALVSELENQYGKPS